MLRLIIYLLRFYLLEGYSSCIKYQMLTEQNDLFFEEQKIVHFIIDIVILFFVYFINVIFFQYLYYPFQFNLLEVGIRMKVNVIVTQNVGHI